MNRLKGAKARVVRHIFSDKASSALELPAVVQQASCLTRDSKIHHPKPAMILLEEIQISVNKWWGTYSATSGEFGL